MHSIGSRGQGFDVFKLLIAAVVAGAILLILLQTLQILPDIGQQSPNNAAANAVKSQVNEPGLRKILENITFKPGDSLNSKTIASQSRSLSEDSICVLIGTSAPNHDQFSDQDSKGKIVEYTGQFAQKTRLWIMCDRQSEIDTSVESYASDSQYGIDLGQCDKLNTDTGTGRYCIVAVISDI